MDAGPRLRGRRSLSRPHGAVEQSPNWRLPTGIASITVSAQPRNNGPVFTVAAAPVKGGSARAAAAAQPSPLYLLVHRPLALLSLVPTELAMFLAGGVAGAIAKTTTAPLDRVRRRTCGGGPLCRNGGPPTLAHVA